MKLKVLADFHHEELFESLRILFEDRLGMELYRQIGREWKDEGYWRVYDHENSVRQLLEPSAVEHFHPIKDNKRFVGDALTLSDGKTLRYTAFACRQNSDGLYSFNNSVYPEQVYKGISLQAFKNTRFDILLCSLPAHIHVFNELKKRYQPHSRVVFQLGNNWEIPDDVEHILSSTTAKGSNKQNYVFYHQEFDTSLFAHSIPNNRKSVHSLMHYVQEQELFFDFESRMPDWSYKMYGGGNRDRPLGPSIKDIADSFSKKMAFLWHVKKEGDGFGYNLHRAAACGRPMIVRSSYFKGMTPEALLEHKKTCIDLDLVNTEEAIRILKHMSDNYEVVSSDVVKRFNSVVNYDSESEEIFKFIGRVLS